MTSDPESELTAETLREIINDGIVEKANEVDLEPVVPAEAIEMYLTDRANELRESSLSTHRSALGFFDQWCSNEGIDDLSKLTPIQLRQYRIWRRDEAPEKVDTLSKKSDKTQQDIIRTFIKYCESINAVKPNLHEKVRSPSMKRGEAVRDAKLDDEQASTILNWLYRYEYASIDHVVWALLTETGIRTGTLHSLDVEDYKRNAEIPHIKIRDRPETGTTLKNGDNGERLVGLTSGVCDIIDDYLDEQRPDCTDEYGRDPFLTAGRGRLSKSTIRKYVYKWTRPCFIGRGCSYGRNPNKCEATKASAASKCPASRSAHAVRRGYITHELSEVDRSFVSDRCDVSEEVIDEHYDARDEARKMSDRQRAFEKARRRDKKYGDE